MKLLTLAIIVGAKLAAQGRSRRSQMIARFAIIKFAQAITKNQPILRHTVARAWPSKGAYCKKAAAQSDALLALIHQHQNGVVSFYTLPHEWLSNGPLLQYHSRRNILFNTTKASEHGPLTRTPTFYCNQCLVNPVNPI